jgi:NitT/TauT family transport system substrate-binding protein
MRVEFVVRRTACAVTAPALVVAIAVAVSGCGGSSSSSGGGSGSGGGTTTISMAVNPYVGAAPLYLGIKQGFFKRQGITLKLDKVTSPPAVLEAVVAKQEDLGFAVLPSVITDVSKGIPIKCIGPWAGNVATDPSQRSTAIVVKKTSPITSATDLVGKKIAEPALGGELPLLTQAYIGEAGGDWRNVKLVPLAFPEMTTALQNGDVDAITTTEPFLAKAVAGGGRVLSWVESEIAGNTSMTCTASNNSWISSNPSLVAKFRTAMQQSLTYAASHIAEARATLPAAVGITAAAAKTVPLGVTYEPKLDLGSIQKIVNLMVKYQYIPKNLPLSRFMDYPGA